MNLYDKDRDHIALGRFYTDHVSAMTREGLHAKSDIAAELAYRDRRIAALEAEKAERERQEPVAWAWNDSLGCMHVHCGSRRPHWVDDECSDSMRAELSLRPLYTHPLVLREPTEDECQRIANEFLILGGPGELAGRIMFNPVREVMAK